jgi:pimeloyl-ACP methyl ester carboxylesterase
MTRAFILFLLIALAGCAGPMKLSARSFDVPRPNGSAIVVTDESLSRDARESVALCVMPSDVVPLEWLNDYAGACAAGCELLMVGRSSSDESRVDDHLLVLRQYLDQRATPARSVIVLGVRAGDAVATTIANREPRVTHLALLAPTHSSPTVQQPVFIAQLGGVTPPPQPNVTVRVYPLADQRWRELGTGRSIRPLIEMDLIAWLTEKGALTNDRATALSKRVKNAHSEWYGTERRD